MSFSGSYTALVTPFREGSFDQTGFASLIERQVSGGITGIVAVGTTGESPTLNHGEHMEVISAAVSIAGGRCKVLAGTGSNSTAEAIDLTIAAEKAGADAALVVAPYYNKPSQEGLYLHFKAIADATKLPIMLYSIPGRCGIEIGVQTTARLAQECSNIVAIKEAGGSVERVSQLRNALPDAFDILSGDDSLTLPFMSVGACGVVSVASNVIPKEVADLVKAFAEGNHQKALALHRRFHSLFVDLFIEPNPVPVKTAMARMGWISDEVRLPLCGMAAATKAKLFATLAACGIPGDPTV
jgi:4-hydroxy-tetrahydrodipicolinate synthase